MPTRERVDAYRLLRDEVERTVGQINGEYEVLGSTPIHYLRHSYPREEMAAMFVAADIMLVTPLRDGMNLVAKEYVSCRNDLGGALVLSEFTGAWHELHQAFICNPHDIEGVKQTIMRAIHTPQDERRRRMKAMRKRVADHDVHRWASRYLGALASARSNPHRSPGPAPESSAASNAPTRPTSGRPTELQSGSAVERDGRGTAYRAHRLRCPATSPRGCRLRRHARAARH